MAVEQILEELKVLQSNILSFIDYEETYDDEKFQYLQEIFDDQKIKSDDKKLKLLLHLLLKISNNHHRGVQFFSKIEKILLFFKYEITKFLTNSQIFDIFKSNKRFLLFLMEEKVFTLENNFVKKMYYRPFSNLNYIEYFGPEISKMENQDDDKFDDDFFRKRKIGENDNYICELIREDNIDEFISFVNQANYSVNTIIPPSIFETNRFLLLSNNKTKLIDYAAFYGSIHIFQYLKMNGADMNSNLWIYAVHSGSAEMIHILEDCKNIYCQYNDYFKEAIKCHNNNIADYIQNNFSINDFNSKIIINTLKCYNFEFIQCEFIYKYFNYLCKYDYYYLAKCILQRYESRIDVNENIIS